MAISSIVKNIRDGTLDLSDNGGSHSLTVAFENGTFKLDVPGPTVELYLDRGQITSPPSLRYGDDQPMTGSFQAYLRDLSDASYITLESLILQSGYAASTWVSTMGATGEVNTYTLLWTVAGTTHGDAANHTISLAYVALKGSISEGKPSMIDISFTSYALYPTVT